MPRRLSPDLAVFLLALLARLAFLFVLDEPLAYTNDLARALQIAAHPDALRYILSSDDWRGWGMSGSDGWTLAPLYYVFGAAVLRAFGQHLLSLQLVQCLLEALTAVGVCRLGRPLAGPFGVAAGVAYAVSWQAIVFHAGVQTETLHTVLLVWALTLLAGSVASGWAAAAGGVLLGLSALTRAVSFAFLPLAAVWQWRTLAGSAGLRRAAVTLGCGLLAVFPWLLRNYRLKGELLPIETVSVFNLWNDNNFVEDGRWGRQARLISKQPTFAGKQAEAARFALLGWTRDPAAGLRKVTDGLQYFLRPTETNNLVIAELPRPAWQHVFAIVFGDVLFAVAVVLALAFVAAGGRSPPRTLVLLWLAYYLLLLVVVFHTQIRYRTAFTPFLFACAAAGAVCLMGAGAQRRRAVFGALAGLLVIAWASANELRAAGRALTTLGPLRSARAALGDGELDRAAALVGRAAQRDPESARPHASFGRSLLDSGNTAEAILAYERSAATKPVAWLPRVVLPRLLSDAGRLADAERALADAHSFSRASNAWLALEVAWRELPAPRTNEIVVGGADYGAVRGFMAPQGHRWSRGRAWLRLSPRERAAHYDLAIEMGSPEPSPWPAPEVRLRVNGAAWIPLVLARRVGAFHVPGTPDDQGALVVELRAPTWSRPGFPPDLGVWVERLSVRPASR